MKLLDVLILFVFGLLLINCRGTKSNSSNDNNNEKWEEIASYFKPPIEFKNLYGDFRSPLKFYNGETVKSTKGWSKRKTEIRTKWMHLMGEWPTVMTNQHFEIIDTVLREDFTQHTVRFYWTPKEQTEAYLLIPNTEGEKPAVITVFYEPETAIGFSPKNKENRDFAYQLTKRGFVTLSLGTTETTENKTYSIYYPHIENATMQPLSALAYAAANAWEALAKIEAVDSSRIGITGHSYGGKWAMFASCLYDKFACAAWSDPGIVFDETKGSGVNYWEPWYLGYYPPPWANAWCKTSAGSKGLYPKLIKENFDLHELHALMAPRPFLVSGGSSDPVDRWSALNHTIDVNKLLGYENRVAMTNRPMHSPTIESNQAIFNFFEWFLSPIK